jgi:hypothetical protein
MDAEVPACRLPAGRQGRQESKILSGYLDVNQRHYFDIIVNGHTYSLCDRVIFFAPLVS